MPVYRPNGDNCVVFADPVELQRWAMSRTNLIAELEKRLSRELSGAERRMIGLAEEILREEAERFGGGLPPE